MKNEDQISRDDRGCRAAEGMWEIYAGLAEVDKVSAKIAAMTFMSLIFNQMKSLERLSTFYTLNNSAEMFQSCKSSEEFREKIQEAINKIRENQS